ncbi:branched-chain amino acid ABC transporter substrate-binding protein [Niveispirillum irakense]|uniref:branched-chain amino acid ABC transporter substrate-binding protein n=1 Tax=Niveispirillum irakense TaxID=34011 RepID=UPI0004000F67|nr:branched-chain amino acid ABC transporter substrate-binding protein [Niveispirillum irakense]
MPLKSLLLGCAALLVSASPCLADIKVGFAAPLSGPLAAVGEQLRTGTQQALADINAKGGVLGEKLVLVTEDDGGLPAQAVSVANKLVTQDVAVVIGHLQTGTTLPAAKIYGDEGILTITPTATAPEVTEDGGDLMFRTCGRDDQQGPVAAAYIARHLKDKRIALLQDQTTYGKGLADATKQALNAAGIQEVLYTSLKGGERDYTALVTRLKAERAEVVYFGGYYSDAAQFVRQMREAGLDSIFISGDTLASDDYMALAGPAGEGTLMSFSADARTLPAAATVLEGFQARGEKPGAYTLYAYAALQVWAQAAEKAGSSDGAKVARALRDRRYDSVIGPLSFDEKGDRRDTDYVIYRWAGGKYSTVP